MTSPSNIDSLTYIWVDSDSKLNQCIEKWQKQSYLILDTEFERSNTYFAIPGVVQVAASGQTYLIDPLSVSSLKPLATVLQNPEIEIVLHSMSEDIDLLSHACECSIRSVFDTQIATAFLGLGISVGYQRLVEMILDIELDKGETRSDWLRRPLSKRQLQYAAADVVYLEDIYKELRKRLSETKWEAAVSEECSRQVEAIEQASVVANSGYLKVRGGWDLSREKQVILRHLVKWRDTMAIQHNIPKSWVFSDAQLIEVARVKPDSLGFLFKLPKVKPKSVKRYGEELLAQLHEVVPEPEQDFQMIERPIKGRELEFYKKIKKAVSIAAVEAGIDPQLIAGRKQMEAWVIHYWRQGRRELPELVNGWRRELIAQRIEKLVAELD